MAPSGFDRNGRQTLQYTLGGERRAKNPQLSQCQDKVQTRHFFAEMKNQYESSVGKITCSSSGHPTHYSKRDIKDRRHSASSELMNRGLKYKRLSRIFFTIGDTTWKQWYLHLAEDTVKAFRPQNHMKKISGSERRDLEETPLGYQAVVNWTTNRGPQRRRALTPPTLQNGEEKLNRDLEMPISQNCMGTSKPRRQGWGNDARSSTLAGRGQIWTRSALVEKKEAAIEAP